MPLRLPNSLSAVCCWQFWLIRFFSFNTKKLFNPLTYFQCWLIIAGQLRQYFCNLSEVETSRAKNSWLQERIQLSADIKNTNTARNTILYYINIQSTIYFAQIYNTNQLGFGSDKVVFWALLSRMYESNHKENKITLQCTVHLYSLLIDYLMADFKHSQIRQLGAEIESISLLCLNAHCHIKFLCADLRFGLLRLSTMKKMSSHAQIGPQGDEK